MIAVRNLAKMFISRRSDILATQIANQSSARTCHFVATFRLKKPNAHHNLLSLLLRMSLITWFYICDILSVALWSLPPRSSVAHQWHLSFQLQNIWVVCARLRHTIWGSECMKKHEADFIILASLLATIWACKNISRIFSHFHLTYDEIDKKTYFNTLNLQS